MNMHLCKHHPLMKMMKNSLIDLPTLIYISSWWNFGSLLGLCLMILIISSNTWHT